MVLCKYGIEYVDDPATGDKVPTCHRSSFDSIFDDEDFEQVMEYADSISKQVYRKEAKQIEDIRKGIIEVSGKEDPYDIFICYKETAEDGQRTIDSVLAQDVYDALVNKGYRVFFSRITLEDKLGTEYEPYIFAALNSAKVMLAFGTCFEYYDAVWVKNEWSRFLKLMGPGKEKYLIPCYKDIDAYDMPKEFNKLQSQDLGKVGATQDLIRGIDKLIGNKEKASEKVVQVVQSTASPTEQSLLDRGFMALEDKEWDNAEKFFERVLDSNPSNAEAYLGKLMVEFKASNEEGLKQLKNPFQDSRNYSRIMQFGSNELKSKVEGIVKFINDRNETDRLNGIYDNAVSKKNKNTEDSLKEAINIFKSIIEWKDSKEQIEICKKNIEIIHDKEIKFIDSYIGEIREKSIESYNNFIEPLRQYIKTIDSKKVSRTLTIIMTDFNQWISKKERISHDYEEDERSYNEVMNNYPTAIEEWKIECARVQDQIDNANLQRNQLKEQINKLNTELKGLGLFAGKRKREINSLLEDLNKRFNSITIPSIPIEPKKPERKYSVKLSILEGIFKINWQLIDLYNCNEKDVVKFGKCENREIEWIVLEKKDNSILLLSKYLLDEKPYNNSYTSVTWETCTIRKWLNNEFINSAFSSEEIEMIQTTNVVNKKNPKVGTSGGNNTKDKVFLLSIDEVNQYFKSDDERKATDINGKSDWWYLRSPGDDVVSAATVYNDGSVDEYGDFVHTDFCIRPAMWINLES